MERRDALKNIGLFGGVGLLGNSLKNVISSPRANVNLKPFKFCFNTSCLMGQNLGIEKEVEIIANAGFDGVEVWIPALEAYKGEGKSIKDLGKKIADLGLKVEDAIGFATWIVDDEVARNAAFEQVKKEMSMLAELGCKRIAAPPMGATDVTGLDLRKAGERFRHLIELGIEEGVIPQLELWGFSKTLSRLSELLYVAAECGHPQTRILTDVYHLHKGGSMTDGLKLIAPDAIEIFHINDYSENISRKEITDADRVFPGDGIAPLDDILTTLAKDRDEVVLSLELFNKEYFKMEASKVAEIGLRKMKAAVERAIG